MKSQAYKNPSKSFAFLFLCALSLALLTACKKNKFGISPHSNDGSALRLSGYYYTKTACANNDSLINILFFYANGVVLFASTFDSQLNDTELDFRNGNYYNSVKNSHHYWGPYKIEGSSLYYERWNPQEFYPIHAFKANITNNRQFELLETYNVVRKKQKNKTTLNNIYRFKAFLPKPDSSNSFVK